MAEFRKMILTKQGQDLIAKLISGSSGVKFTRIALSSAVYTDAQIPGLTTISGIQQTAEVSRVTKLTTAAVKLEGVITNDKLKNFVHCTFEDNILKLKCTTSIGQAYDECYIDPQTGDDLVIGFNSRYLLDALRACHDEIVRLELNTPTSPCLIKPKEGEQYLYLILPVRLKA